MTDKKYHCAFCGVRVGPNDWAGIGRRNQYICDSDECNAEAVQADREAYDDACEDAMRAVDDEFGRW